MYSDFTAVHAQLGAHIELLEMDDLAKRVAAASHDDVGAKLATAREVFAIEAMWPRAIWIGPRAWLWGSTAWSRISRSTASPITTAA